MRKGLDWGYMFGSDDLAGAPGFLFHGSRPASEPGRASIVRCDFARQVDPAEILRFTQLLLLNLECVCGTAGYVIAQGEAEGASDAAPTLTYALAMRFWGAEAQDLDVTLDCALEGFPCINWLTVIGPRLLGRDPDAVNQAKAAAHATIDVDGHVIIGVEPRPRLIDRNRRESLGRYPMLAQVLLPLQIANHPAFGGPAWDEDSTRRYLRRFSEARASR